MSLYDDNSLVWAVLVPVAGGVIGLLALGPLGFFLGAVIPLVIGANATAPETEKDERIAELERQVEELEQEEA